MFKNSTLTLTPVVPMRAEFKMFVYSFSFPLLREGCGMLPLFYPPEGLRGLLGPNPVQLIGEGQGTEFKMFLKIQFLR